MVVGSARRQHDLRRVGLFWGCELVVRRPGFVGDRCGVAAVLADIPLPVRVARRA